MSIQKSSYILLATLKARYELEKDKGSTGVIVRLRFARKKKRKETLILKFNYINENHLNYFTPHSMAKSNGCGCAYCTALHEYSYSKLLLHYLKKSFETDFAMEVISITNNSKLPLSSNFYVQYANYTATVKEDSDKLSQLEFFNKLFKERKEESKKLRIKYKTIKKSIDALLID